MDNVAGRQCSSYKVTGNAIRIGLPGPCQRLPQDFIQSFLMCSNSGHHTGHSDKETYVTDSGG